MLIICPCCGTTLEKPGAMLHKPMRHGSTVNERHMICRNCHEKFMNFIGDGKLSDQGFDCCYYSCPPDDESYSVDYFIPRAIVEAGWRFVCGTQD